MDWIATFVQTWAGNMLGPVAGGLRFQADDYDAAEDYAKCYADAFNVKLTTIIATRKSFGSWDGRTEETIYIKEGSGSLEIVGHEDAMLFLRVSGWETDYVSCWTIEEAEILHLQLGRKIAEARMIRQRNA